jgi:hypothetical protein
MALSRGTAGWRGCRRGNRRARHAVGGFRARRDRGLNPRALSGGSRNADTRGESRRGEHGQAALS